MHANNNVSLARKLIVHFSQFLGGSVLIMLFGFLTFPILTRVLSREDYGILGLVTNTVLIAVAIGKGGLSDSVIRFYPEYASSADRLTLFNSTVLVRGVALSAVVATLFLLAAPALPRLVGLDPEYVGCFEVMALYLFVRPLNIIVLNYLRAVEKIALLNAVNVVAKIAGIGMGFAFLLLVIGKLYGYFLGIALAELGAGIYLYRWLLTSHKFSISRVSGSLSVDLIKFGLPLLLSELSYLLLSYADRYMVLAYLGPNTLGIYAVGYSLPGYINDIVMFSLSYAVVPIYNELYLREGKTATERFLSHSLNYYLMAMIPVCAGYAAVVGDLIYVLASSKYEPAAVFSPAILVARVLLGMNSMLYAGLYVNKRSGQILAGMLSAVVVDVGANLILLPRYGASGAAMATLIACGTSSVLMTALSYRYVRPRMAIRSIVYYLAVSAVMYGLVSQLETGSHWLNLVVRIPAGACLVAVAMIMHDRQIRAYVLRIMRRASGQSPEL